MRKRSFAPLCAHDFSSHDLTVLKQNSSQIKRFINKPGPRLCHNSVIWGLNWQVRLANLLYLIYVKIEHANFQPSQVRIDMIQLRIFFSFLIIDYLYVLTYVKFVNCDCHINSNHFLLSISMHRKPYFHSRNRVMIIHVDDCVFPSILQKWDKLLTNYIILTYV